MKIKRPIRLVPLFTLCAALMVLAGTAGCVAVAAGAGAGAAVAYVRGELEATLDGDFESAMAATNRAMEQRQLAKISERKDALTGIIVARNAVDKKIEIRLDSATRKLTKIRIRVGVFGDESLSIAILEKVKANL